MNYSKVKEEYIEGEEWKPVVGYEGYYEVSNLGRVRSVSRIIPRNKNRPNHHETGDRYMNGIILCQEEQKPPLGNYLRVRVSVAHKPKNLRVHRLVAKAFIPNPNNYPDVNHIDNDPTNNRVENLEWTTPKLNEQHKIKQGRNSKVGITAMIESNKKPVVGIDAEGNREYYNSAKEASKAMGLKNATNISNVCLGRKKTSAGRKWKYVSDLVKEDLKQ